MCLISEMNVSMAKELTAQAINAEEISHAYNRACEMIENSAKRGEFECTVQFYTVHEDDSVNNTTGVVFEVAKKLVEDGFVVEGWRMHSVGARNLRVMWYGECPENLTING